jgi:hypothetical protein
MISEKVSLSGDREGGSMTLSKNKNGFYYVNEDKIFTPIIKRIIEKFNDFDKNFYDNIIPVILCKTELRMITCDTIPEIHRRLLIVDLGMVQSIEHDVKVNLSEYLRKFIGYWSDLKTTDSKEFWKGRTKPEVPPEIPYTFMDRIVDELTDRELPLFINVNWVTATGTHNRFKARFKKEKIKLAYRP